MDNSVGIDCGSWGGMDEGGQGGKNWDNCNRITIKNETKEYQLPSAFIPKMCISKQL